MSNVDYRKLLKIKLIQKDMTQFDFYLSYIAELGYSFYIFKNCLNDIQAMKPEIKEALDSFLRE